MDLSERIDAALEAAVDRDALRTSMLHERRKERAARATIDAIIAHLRPLVEGKTAAQILADAGVDLAQQETVIGKLIVNATSDRLRVESSGLFATMFDEFAGAATVTPGENDPYTTLDANELRRTCMASLQLTRMLREDVQGMLPPDLFTIGLRSHYRGFRVQITYNLPDYGQRNQRALDRVYRELRAELDGAGI
jgi:hypothetical protein